MLNFKITLTIKLKFYFTKKKNYISEFSKKEFYNKKLEKKNFVLYFRTINTYFFVF